METAWNSWRRREDKSKHENAFIYFLVRLHLCPSKPQAVILMNAFKPQRELRRTIFDRSEEGAKYNSPVREMYSRTFSSPLPSLSGQSCHLSVLFLHRSSRTTILAVTWWGPHKDHIMRYDYVLRWKGHSIWDDGGSISKLILHIFPQYNFHLPNT